jgi:iron complex transport system substrate-binding protein
MSRLVIGALLAAALAVAPAAGAAPRRVVSLNLCTDELLLALGDRSQIASVSHLSHISHETPYWGAARAFPANDGSILSVVARKPDLILTMGGGGRDSERLARRMGARLVTLPYMMTLNEMKTGVGSVAEALGRRQAGERLLAPLAALERSRPARMIDTVWMGGGGRSLPATGLGADWMALAGLRQRALTGDRVTLEQLLVRPPALLLRSDYRSGQYSGEQRWLSHPLAGRANKARTIHTDGRLWTCMGPSLIPEIARIRKEMWR